AMFSALSSKVSADEFIVIDKIEASEFKTKTMVKMLDDVKAGKKALVVLPECDEKAIYSLRNIEGVKVTQWNTLNVYDILNCDSLVAAKDAVTKIEEVYNA
ncbi:MAG: 50S ribosomal protein L4, partial [Clostridia bacterium]|nr:50S ribosomal protein L4 [Clostridia bacterium]